MKWKKWNKKPLKSSLLPPIIMLHFLFLTLHFWPIHHGHIVLSVQTELALVFLHAYQRFCCFVFNCAILDDDQFKFSWRQCCVRDAVYDEYYIKFSQSEKQVDHGMLPLYHYHNSSESVNLQIIALHCCGKVPVNGEVIWTNLCWICVSVLHHNALPLYVSWSRIFRSREWELFWNGTEAE